MTMAALTVFLFLILMCPLSSQQTTTQTSKPEQDDNGELNSTNPTPSPVPLNTTATGQEDEQKNPDQDFRDRAKDDDGKIDPISIPRIDSDDDIDEDNHDAEAPFNDGLPPRLPELPPGPPVPPQPLVPHQPPAPPPGPIRNPNDTDIDGEYVYNIYDPADVNISGIHIELLANMTCCNGDNIDYCGKTDDQERCPTPDPDDLFPPKHCPTCATLGCGSVVDTDENLHCSCDALCVLHGDCCSDFFDICVDDNKEAHKLIVLDIPQPECVKVPGIDKKLPLVASCKSEKCPVMGEGETNLERLPIPATDPQTGIHYSTLNCAKCNGANQTKAWKSHLVCNGDVPISITRAVLVQLLVNGTCSLVNTQPDVIRPCLPDVVSSCSNNSTSPSCYDTTISILCDNTNSTLCNDTTSISCNTTTTTTTSPSTCNNTFLNDLCQNGNVQYVNFFLTDYRNIYCALCNLCLDADSLELVMRSNGGICGLYDSDMDLDFDYGKFPAPGSSLVILFDFDQSDSTADLDAVFCAQGYMLIDNECLSICPGGSVFYDTCLITSSEHAYIYIVIQAFQPVEFLSMVELLAHIANNKLIDMENNNIKPCESPGSNVFLKCDETQSFHNDNDKSLTLQNVTCQVDYSFFCEIDSRNIVNPKEMKIALMNRNRLLTQKTTKHLESIFTKSILLDSEVEMLQVWSEWTFDDSIEIPSNGSKPESDCVRVKITEDRYEFVNGSLKVDVLSALVPEDEFVLENGTAFVCREFYEKHYDGRLAWLNRESLAMKITSDVALSVSIICLVIRLLLQPIVPVFHTLPNKLQFCLCLTLCLAFLFFLLAPLTSEHPSVCYVFSVFIHWGFLATFFSMMSVALHMFRTFRPSSLQKQNPSRKVFAKYLLLQWLPPTTVVCVSIALDFLPVEPYYQPQYGVPACWIGGRFAHIVYFGVPLAAVLIINIALLIATSINLHRAFSTSATVNKRSRSYELRLNIRLAVLLGGTWIVAFVAAAINHAVLWYIFIVLCGLQGLFIFLSFVCTQQVWKSFKESWIKSPDDSAMSIQTKTSSVSATSVKKKETQIFNGNGHSDAKNGDANNI